MQIGLIFRRILLQVINSTLYSQQVCTRSVGYFITVYVTIT